MSSINSPSGINWSNRSIEESGVYTTEDEDVAMKDYNGEYNTKVISSQVATSHIPAFSYCTNFVFPNGNHGYLGAAGEWHDLYLSKELVDKCMVLIGGEEFIRAYQTSTQAYSSANWVFSIKGYASIANKVSHYLVRPFTSL